ncbi:MAG: 23S rRNA (pseudouridine(1915)-N(3))-methyltransferase RlmH [Pseudomonadota bacterium]
MRLVIAAVGKTRSGPEKTLFDDYLKRASGLGRPLGLRGPEFTEFEISRARDRRQRQAAEGGQLMGAIAAGGYLIALDERGENLASQAFADLLGRVRDDGAPQLVLAIGGADGHDGALRDRADKLVAFGNATWPHMLVRVMLAEQVYRAMTILAGHPYHRDS